MDLRRDLGRARAGGGPGRARALLARGGRGLLSGCGPRRRRRRGGRSWRRLCSPSSARPAWPRRAPPRSDVRRLRARCSSHRADRTRRRRAHARARPRRAARRGRRRRPDRRRRRREAGPRRLCGRRRRRPRRKGSRCRLAWAQADGYRPGRACCAGRSRTPRQPEAQWGGEDSFLVAYRIGDCTTVVGGTAPATTVSQTPRAGSHRLSNRTPTTRSPTRARAGQ